MPEIKISDLTSANVPSGGEVFAVVQNNITRKTTIDSLKDALVDNLSTGAPTWDVNGNLTAGFDIIAGGNHDGRVALTINDGYGNANLTFNHTNGVPDKSGSSARIAVNVDSNQEAMEFQLKGSVTAGSAVTLTPVLKLRDDNIQLLKKTTLSENGTVATSLVNKGYIDTALNLKATTTSVTAVSSSLTNHIEAGHPTIHAAVSHTHPIGDITDLQTSLNTLQTNINGKIGESEIETADFTFANNTLSLNTILEGHIGELQISAGKIKNYAITANKLKGTESIAQGDFLIYDATTGGFETTASTSETHKLFSPNHTDVASNVTPSYGDSMYYNGTEWTTGNFGNYGADMEYVGITGISGVTNTMLDTRPSPDVDVSDRILSTSLTVDTDLLGTQAGTQGDNIQVSGYVTYPIANLVGGGLINDNIRGIYIKVFAYWAIGRASDLGQKAQINVIYPDGTEHSLIATPESRSSTYLGTTSDQFESSEQVFLIPVNEGQQDFVIGFDVDDNTSDHERIVSEIIGVQCTKRVALSPDVDIIHIVGSQDSAQRSQGYVDVGTNSFSTNTSVWSSENPTSVAAADWSGVFPITIPDNVSKTVIRLVNNWNFAGTSSEEVDNITITVDWNAGTINGIYTWNAEFQSTGFLYASDLVGEKQFTTEEPSQYNSTPSIIKFQIIGRDIVKLPCPSHGGTYYNTGQTYTIENYKTNATSTYEPYDSSFGMFFDPPNHMGYSTFFGSSYISKDGNFIFSGGGGTYVLNGSSPAAQASYTRVQLPLEVGEKVVEYYYSGSNYCSAFLLTDRGNVFGSGYGGTGQLGQGNFLDQTTFTKIISDVAFLSVGNGNTHYMHCLAIKNNGTAWSWGNNRSNELGRGTPANHTSVVNSSPAQIPGFGATGKIAKKAFAFNSVSSGKSFIITEDRKIWACGSAYDGGLGLAASTATFTDTGRVGDYMTANSTDDNKSVFIVDGTDLWAAGDNAYGQLGLGNTTANKADKYFFELVPNISVAQISVSGTNCSTAVLETDGSLKTWGYNANGQLGLGDLIQRGTPVDSELGNDIKKVKLFGPDSYNAIYVLKNDGTVWVSGYNGYGQLGLGDTTSRSAFEKMIKADDVFIKDFQLFGYNSQNAFVGADQYDNLWGVGQNSTYIMLSTTNGISVDRSILTQIDAVDGGVSAVSGLPKIIAGSVAADGTVNTGTGFTSTKVSTGRYRLTFPESATYVVVASNITTDITPANGTTSFHPKPAEIYNLTSTTVDIKIAVNGINGYYGEAMIDSAFMFYAIKV